ncbi:MAG: porin family protein [Bacteroidales bacterium]
MKKLSLTMFVLFCLTSLLFSQSSRLKRESNFSIGILGGLNIPRLSGGNGNELSRDYTSRSGSAFGLTASLVLSPHFALTADLLYSSEGGKRNGLQALDASSINPLVPAGTYFYANFNNQSILNYAEIPVMVKYIIPVNKSQMIYVDFGPYVGYLLNAEQKTSGSSIVYADAAGTQAVSVDPQTGQPFPVPFNANTGITSSINTVNFGLTGGAGFAQMFNSSEVFLDVRGAYGLTVIQKESQNGNSHNGNLLIDLGYALHF